MPLTLTHLPGQDASSCHTNHDGGLRFPAGKPAAPRESAAARPLALWHLSSFDAPTVAVIWSLGFAWAAGARLARWVPALLALTVWTVYVFDRLLDAHAALRTAELGRLRERHYFHWRHRRVLLPLAAAAACAAAGLILAFMPAVARERGSVLAAASLAYFARVHSGHRPRPFLAALLTKELLVGLLFTAGCALPAFGALRTSAHASLWPLACAAAYFASLAWLNCHAIDRWESQTERQAGISLAACACLLAVCALLAATAAWAHPRVAALLAAGAVSALLLALLDLKRNSLGQVTLRAVADLALLTPAPLLALAWLAR
ncbi:MAG: hypothetical protein WBE38_15390 [Terracidiphilus sp.]